MSTDLKALEAEVINTLERWSLALLEKDLDALGECYAEDVRVFDLGTQVNSFEQLRGLWESCFPYFTNSIGVDRRDVDLNVNSELAVISFLSRLTGMTSDHPSAKSWMRTTVCMRKFGDQWKIFHDHISLPVDCGAEKPTYILDDN